MKMVTSPHILLVDDSVQELQQLSATLRAEGFRLSMASDGRTGYQRAVVTQPDLILLDLIMPLMDGLSACRLLKADPATRHIPVIFLTAKNEPEERLRGFQLGGVDYVAKPVLAAEVVARVRIHLNRRDIYRPQRDAAMTPSTNPDDVLFEAAMREIREHLEALPSIPEIAQRVGTHDKRLGQIFRERLGLTVSAFIGEERIRQGRDLLAKTDMGVEQIATQVGFGTGANFTTAFRKRMGMTPTHYRQAIQSQPPELA